MKITWQEKFARWVLKPKPPAKLNERMKHWWVLLIMGILFSLPILWASGKVSDSTFNFAAKYAEENIAQEFAHAVSFGYYLFAASVFGFFAIMGVIYEERKGYQLIIAKLESKAEPVDIANASNAASVNLNHSAHIR